MILIIFPMPGQWTPGDTMWPLILLSLSWHCSLSSRLSLRWPTVATQTQRAYRSENYSVFSQGKINRLGQTRPRNLFIRGNQCEPVRGRYSPVCGDTAYLSYLAARARTCDAVLPAMLSMLRISWCLFWLHTHCAAGAMNILLNCLIPVSSPLSWSILFVLYYIMLCNNAVVWKINCCVKMIFSLQVQ